MQIPTKSVNFPVEMYYLEKIPCMRKLSPAFLIFLHSVKMVTAKNDMIIRITTIEM